VWVLEDLFEFLKGPHPLKRFKNKKKGLNFKDTPLMSRISRKCIVEDELIFSNADMQNMILNRSLTNNTAFHDQKSQI
jgi:hypothetical protein